MKLLNIVFYEETHAEIYYDSEGYFRKSFYKLNDPSAFQQASLELRK